MNEMPIKTSSPTSYKATTGPPPKSYGSMKGGPKTVSVPEPIHGFTEMAEVASPRGRFLNGHCVLYYY